MISHWSHTSINMLSKCARQFYYRYILGWKQPPTGALEFGKAYHRTVEGSFTRYMREEMHYSPEQAEDVFSDEFDRLSQDVEWDYEDEQKGPLKDKGVTLVGDYITYYAPNRRPDQVELEFSVDLSAMGVMNPLVGVIDLVEKGGVLVDHKTSGKSWGEARLANTMQPEPYYIAYRSLYGKYPKRFAFDVAVKIKSPKIQYDLSTTRTQAQLEGFVNRLIDAEQLVGANVYPKTNPDNWYCSPKWCGYYDHCMRGVPMHQLRVRRDDGIVDLGDHDDAL